MVSLTGAWSHFVSSYHSFGSCPDFPLLVSVTHPRKQRHCSSLHLFVAKGGGSPGFSCFRKRSSWIGFVPRCKRWESEGDPDLEAEIMEFMQKSEKPDVFPSKKELIAAGRSDLVEGILEEGGWLSLGWDLDEEETVREDEFRDWNLVKEKKSGDDDSRIFEQGLESRKGSDYSEEIEVGSSGTSCSSSGRSTEMEVRDDAGIEGILSRLEKERNLSLGFGLKESSSGVRSNDSPRSISGDAVGGLEKSSRSTSLRVIEDLANDSGAMLSKDGSTLDNDDCIKNPPKPEMWRTWSLQRAGFSDADFEAAEIAANESGIGGMTSSVDDKIFALHKVENVGKNYKKELNAGVKESDRNQIQSRLKRLESELAAVLHSVRSSTEEVVKKRVEGTSSEELQKLSDALEFQETEIMNAKDQLRSTQAKLAVLEGKMALAIIEAQKVVEEKQKWVDDATKSLSLLRTTCIVWPNAASEVLLAGSFDGWVTQRKMERSSTGIFSVCLKLYPGRYEIKFIVDGIWKIDPLRPIVNNNGYENNLLIIS